MRFGCVRKHSTDTRNEEAVGEDKLGGGDGQRRWGAGAVSVLRRGRGKAASFRENWINTA